MEIRFETATQYHVAAMLPHVRQADHDELYAASKLSAEVCMTRGIMESDWASTFIVDSHETALFGVYTHHLDDGVGIPWMISTHFVERYKRPFLAASVDVVNQMSADYRHLFNFVDDRNKLAIRWLEWVGFDMGEPQPFGPLGFPFRRFEMTRHV